MSTVTEQPGGDVSESTRGNKGLLIGVGLGAIAVVGGGAAAAMMMLGGGGDQPDSVMPDSVAAFVRVDLDPKAGQKVAAVRFFQGLDADTKARLDAGEWREYVWEKLTEEGQAPAGLDYQEDIEPWLGDRAGFGLMAPATEGEEPITVFALQVKDGQKALDTMDRLKAAQEGEDTDLDYYVADDYLVIVPAGTTATVKAAVEQGTLADLDAYTSDMSDLGDAGIASYWADMEAFVEVADRAGLSDEAAAMGGATGGGAFTGMFTPDQLDMMKGRSAGSVRLSPDAIEVHGISRGTEASGMSLVPAQDSPRIINQLPADTVAALSLENGAEMVQRVWDQLSVLDPEGMQEAQSQASAAGFTLPDDIKTLFGDSMTLSVGPGLVEAFNTMSSTETGMPQLPIAYRVHTDTTRVNTLLADAGMPPSMLAQRTDDGVLSLGLYQPYVDGVASASETLTGTSKFSSAVAEADKASSVFYVDVNEFEQDYLPLVEDQRTRDALESLGAIGWSSVADSDGEGHFTLRFVADQE